MVAARVLLLTNEQDVSADWVVRELRHRSVPFLRLNTERIARATVALRPVSDDCTVVRHDGLHADLSGVDAIWYRRPEPPVDRVSGLTAPERALVTSQWRALVDTLCARPGIRLVNSPWANQRVECKPYQLHVASVLGFHVPDTLVTNSRAQALDFYDGHDGRIIVKGLDAPLLESEDPAFVYAQPVDRVMLSALGTPDVAPVIVQQRIEGKTDIRVTVIGDRVLAARTVAPEGVLDWRAAMPRPTFKAHVLPHEIRELCRALVQEMGLLFGAIDLAVDGDDYYFLEINPNGEWGWLQKTVGLPVAEALADVLVQ